MERILIVLIFLFGHTVLNGQTVNLITVDELEKRIYSGVDTVYIVNFWATWCGPCVRELPHFQRLQSELKNQPAKILLVSLDFLSKFEKQVKPFVRRRKLRGEVFLLNETNQQEYIDRIDKSWSGTIPATLFVYKGNRRFMERTFSYPELLEVYNHLK